MAWLSRFFWAAVALLVFFFAALAVNQEHIALEFIVWETPRISVFWWLLAAFALGLLLGLLGITVLSTRFGFRNRALSKRLEESERERRRVRNMTLHE
ncbi:MAG: lipopolysaccharide assembly protein LapA domain-containing protein [Pseudomonadales bacterium]